MHHRQMCCSASLGPVAEVLLLRAKLYWMREEAGVAQLCKAFSGS